MHAACHGVIIEATAEQRLRQVQEAGARPAPYRPARLAAFSWRPPSRISGTRRRRRSGWGSGSRARGLCS
eukprot:4825464-Pleurochrysis_carterae.AAC.1